MFHCPMVVVYEERLLWINDYLSAQEKVIIPSQSGNYSVHSISISG